MAVLKYAGGEYTFEFEQVSAEEWREVKRKLGLTIRGVLEGIGDVDIDAITALRWLILRSDRRHDDLVLKTDEEFEVFALMEPWGAYELAKAEEKEPDPTPAGSLPATPTPASTGSSTPTSDSSSSSTPSPSPATAGSANGKPDGSPSPGSSAT